MESVRVKDRGVVGMTAYRPVLVWLAVALMLLMAGCSGAPAAAGDPDQEVRPTGGHHPTAYPEAEAAPDEVVLKWNGTLVVPGEDQAYR